MRRWLLFVIGIAVLVVLLSPGAVGRIAQATLSDNLSWIDSENDDVDIEVLAYDRGWFSSTGRHRLVVRDGALATALAAAGSGGPLAFIVETKLDHGLFALAPIMRSGSLQPRLASAESVLLIDRGPAGTSDFPGTLYSHLGVLGDSSFRYTLQPGEQTTLGGTASWSEGDLFVTASARKQTLGVACEIADVALDAAGVRGRIDSAQVDARHDRSQLAFGVGELDVSISGLEMQTDDGVSGGLTDFIMSFASRLENEGLAGRLSVNVEGGQLPDVGKLDAASDIRFEGLDAAAVEGILRGLRATNDARLAESMLEGHLRALAAGGGELEVRELLVSVPEGTLRATLSGDWPNLVDDGDINWASFALQSSAEADVEIDSALYDAFVKRMPDAGALLGLGLLQKKGDRYTMTAELDGGLLKINGAPMPLGQL